MGIDLKLLPIEHESDVLCYSHTILDCARNYDMHKAVESLNPSLLRKKVGCYIARNSDGESSYGDVGDDDYGDALTYIEAGLLSDVSDDVLFGRNVAVWAYLRQLPPETKIILYWC